jgi:transposase InsO family protein
MEVNQKFELILDKLYVTVDFLTTELKIPEGSIHNGASKNRRNKSTLWRYVNHPLDKRKILIQYESIPLSYYKKYDLPKEEVLYQKIIAKKKRLINERFEETKKELSINFEITYKYAYKRFLKYYYDQYRTDEKSDLYAKTHAILVLVQALNNEGHKLLDLHPYFLKYKLSVSANNLNGFYRLIRDCDEKSIEEIVIHGAVNKGGCYKMTLIHEKILKKLYRNPQKYSMPIIFKMANDKFLDLEISTLSLSTIKLYLSQNEIQNSCLPFRNGKKWAEDNLLHYANKVHIEYPGEQWQLDGSKFQFNFLTKNNKVGSLRFFVVLDSFSRKIIGCSISKSENTQLIMDSLIDAVKNTNYLPKEIVYDNAKPFFTPKFKRLIAESSCAGVYWRASKVGDPKDKGKVERFVNTFQTRICSKEFGFIGEGKKSKRQNFTLSDERLKYLKLKKNLRSEEELTTLFYKLIEEYNQTEINNKVSANTLHITKIASPSINLSNHLIAKLFWKETLNTLTNNLILINKNSITYRYKLDDDILSIKLNGFRFKVYSNHIDHSKIYLFNIDTDEYITSLKQDISINGLSYLLTKDNNSEILKNANRNKKINDLLNSSKESEEISLEEDIQDLIASKAGVDTKKIRRIKSIEKDFKKIILTPKKSSNNIIERMKNPYQKKGSNKIIEL